MDKMTRRIFVGAGAAVVVLGGSSFLACSARQSDQVAQFDRLDILLDDIPQPERIGRAFRAAMGRDRLVDMARETDHIMQALAYECPGSRRTLLRDGARTDFASGRVVICDRFVMSRTECIVAGLRYDHPVV